MPPPLSPCPPEWEASALSIMPTRCSFGSPIYISCERSCSPQDRKQNAWLLSVPLGAMNASWCAPIQFGGRQRTYAEKGPICASRPNRITEWLLNNLHFSEKSAAAAAPHIPLRPRVWNLEMAANRGRRRSCVKTRGLKSKLETDIMRRVI